MRIYFQIFTVATINANHPELPTRDDLLLKLFVWYSRSHKIPVEFVWPVKTKLSFEKTPKILLLLRNEAKFVEWMAISFYLFLYSVYVHIIHYRLGIDLENFSQFQS